MTSRTKEKVNTLKDLLRGFYHERASAEYFEIVKENCVLDHFKGRLTVYNATTSHLS